MKMPAATKPAVWGAVGGAVALTIFGFAFAGWVTGGTAAQAAKNSAESAVVAVLTPICVIQFRADTDATAKLAELKALARYQQPTYVEKGGWATMPGATVPESGVASACATALIAAT